MGSFGNDFIIYIREQDGFNSMFSAGELRARLYRCLSAAYVENPEDAADDITLAVEYSLLNRQQNGGIIDRGELDAAVTRLLEETGFSEAALFYRGNAGFEDEVIRTSEAALSALISRRISCRERDFQAVVGDVLNAARKLGIEEASPHLYLELARYFVKRNAQTGHATLPELPRLDSEKLERLPGIVSSSALQLMESGVISIQGLTAIFPCVRFHVSMQEFCRFFDVASPVTELLIYPAVNQVSAALEECRLKLCDENDLASSRLPCTLTIRDLRQFVREAFECTSELAAETLAAELANLFAPGDSGNIFKLDYD